MRRAFTPTDFLVALAFLAPLLVQTVSDHLRQTQARLYFVSLLFVREDAGEAFGGFYDVAEECDVGDRADAAGNRSDRTGNLYRGFEMNVAFKHAVDDGR